MSEQEKKNSSTADLSVVLVEQSATSRHKQPFRPVEMQEEGSKELQHKRSKAPPVPSITEDNVNIESKGNTESERAVSSEKHKYNVAKKLSSVTKRRPSSPETITLTPLIVDMKARPMNLPSDHTALKNSLTPSQPIPAQVSPTADDSDLATKHSDVAKVSSEWIETVHGNKKEVSWTDEDYLTRVILEDARVKPCVLERKSSLGPCFRVAAPFGRPSGLAICLAKRCTNPETEDHKPAKSKIDISLSKRCLVNKTIYQESYISVLAQKKKSTPTVQSQETPNVNFLGTLKEKISNLGDKIKNTFA